MAISFILMLAALVLFILAAIGVGLGRVNTVAAGLACMAGALLLGGYSV